jgi:hypothetical protein
MKDGMKKHRMGDDIRKKKGWKGGTILPDPSELKPCKSFLILILFPGPSEGFLSGIIARQDRVINEKFSCLCNSNHYNPLCKIVACKNKMVVTLHIKPPYE